MLFFEEKSEIYFISLQNIENTKNEETDKGVFWNTLFKNTFDEKDYICLMYKQSFGFFITCWIQKSLLERISETKIEKSKKGYGICYQIYIDTLRICFVNSQFVDGQGKLKQRNEQYTDMIENISFGENIGILKHE